MHIRDILASVESGIASQNERAYFLIHEARYKRILEEINSIRQKTDAGGGGIFSQDDKRTAGPRKNTHSAGVFRILDVGCYPYHLGAALEKMRCDVRGIASSHEPIANKKVSILNIETDAFPYKCNTFDLVLCSEVIEHLPQSPVPALREMYRVTKKGGHVVITTPNINRSINQGKMLLGRSPMYDVDAFLENGGKGSNLYHRHNREFTLAELTRLVSHAGWSVREATHFISYSPFRRRNRTDHPLVWTGKFANFLAMSAIPRLRDTLLVTGLK